MDAAVFVSWNGKPFEYSGNISQASNAISTKAGLDKHCGENNRYCKAAVSATRAFSSADDQICQDLVNLMGHQKNH